MVYVSLVDDGLNSGSVHRYLCAAFKIIYNMNELILTKQSSESDLKRYFAAVLELSKSDNKFPINLDEVWPLVYSAKEKAVRALKHNFFQDVDYQLLAQNGEKSFGRPNDTYYISLSCMEYFIARKVRPVFEVYRQVFHKTAEQPKQLSASEIMLMQAQMLVESEKRMNKLEKKIQSLQGHQNRMDSTLERMEERTGVLAYWTTVAGYAIRHKVDMSLQRAMEIGKKCTKIATEYKYTVEKVRDVRFGTVNAYPDWILARVFTEYYPKVKFSY